MRRRTTTLARRGAQAQNRRKFLSLGDQQKKSATALRLTDNSTEVLWPNLEAIALLPGVLHCRSRLMMIRPAEPSLDIRQAPGAKTAKARCRFF